MLHDIEFGRLDLNLLRVLHVLLEERSVTRAAARLNLSPSATSHSLARLREHFGDPLLTRTAFGMQPTSRAETMAPRLSELMERIRGLTVDDGFEPQNADALVRLTAMTTAMMAIVPGFVRELSRRAPGLRLECRQWAANTVEEINAGRIYFAIGTRAQCEQHDLEMQPLMTDGYVCVVRHDHPVAASGLSLEAYETWPHLLIDSSDLSTGAVNQVLEALGVSRGSTLTTYDTLMAHLVVEQTDMILTVTRIIGEMYARSADVVVLEPPVDVGELTLYLAWHPRMNRDPLHSWLRELILECRPG